MKRRKKLFKGVAVKKSAKPFFVEETYGGYARTPSSRTISVFHGGLVFIKLASNNPNTGEALPGKNKTVMLSPKEVKGFESLIRKSKIFEKDCSIEFPPMPDAGESKYAFCLDSRVKTVSGSSQSCSKELEKICRKLDMLLLAKKIDLSEI